MMKWRDRRGQSIIEYLVVAAAIVIAIFAARVTMQTKAGELMNASADKLVFPAAP